MIEIEYKDASRHSHFEYDDNELPDRDVLALFWCRNKRYEMSIAQLVNEQGISHKDDIEIYKLR